MIQHRHLNIKYMIPSDDTVRNDIITRLGLTAVTAAARQETDIVFNDIHGYKVKLRSNDAAYKQDNINSIIYETIAAHKQDDTYSHDIGITLLTPIHQVDYQRLRKTLGQPDCMVQKNRTVYYSDKTPGLRAYIDEGVQVTNCITNQRMILNTTFLDLQMRYQDDYDRMIAQLFFENLVAELPIVQTREPYGSYSEPI